MMFSRRVHAASGNEPFSGRRHDGHYLSDSQQKNPEAVSASGLLDVGIPPEALGPSLPNNNNAHHRQGGAVRAYQIGKQIKHRSAWALPVAKA